MSEENLNSLNEEQGDVVDSQNENLSNDGSDVSTSENVDNESSKTSEVADPKQNQSKEENDKYAAARKEAERQAKEVESKYQRDLGISRKYSKDYDVFCEEDIRTKYDMSLGEFEDALLQQQYKDAGLDPNLINQAIANNPIVKEATQYVNQTKQQQAQEQVKKDIETLHKDVPGTDHIKTLEDLKSDPKWNDIVSLIGRGYEMPDAYFKVYKNDVEGNKQKKAVKSTIADIADRSKRGTIASSDGYNDDTVVSDLSPEGLAMTKAFGNDPREIAKYKKQILKK